MITNYSRIQALIANEEMARGEIFPMLISLLETGEECESSLGEPMIIKETMLLFKAIKEYMITTEELINLIKHLSPN